VDVELGGIGKGGALQLEVNCMERGWFWVYTILEKIDHVGW
jgi:hypothetical protein